MVRNFSIRKGCGWWYVMCNGSAFAGFKTKKMCVNAIVNHYMKPGDTFEK